MIILADERGKGDGPAQRLMQMVKTEVPILLISRVDDLVFNPAIEKLKHAPYVIVDYIENGWAWDRKNTLIVGENATSFDFCRSDGWKQLDEFVCRNPAHLYFKRELLADDADDTLLPCEYPNWFPAHPIETREQFNARPLSVFNYWGRSHEARLMLHGEIWKHASRKGYEVCDNIYQFNAFMQYEKNPNKWVTFHMPWYSRVDMAPILEINALSKLSVSLPGAGVKCFRSTGEALVNSVVILPEDNLAYSYPLIDGVNCIRIPISSVDGSIAWPVCQAIEGALQRDDLYDIYLKGLAAADWYRAENYVQYLADKINAV